jgi:hypothetical protein
MYKIPIISIFLGIYLISRGLFLISDMHGYIGTGLLLLLGSLFSLGILQTWEV